MAQSRSMPEAFQPEVVSWTALLGRWMDFARASRALPKTPEGDQWRDSVTPMITLQAITFSLSEMESVRPAERLLGWDRADLLYEESMEALDEAWGPRMPADIVDTIEQAEQALEDVLDRFHLVLVHDGSEPLPMPSIESIDPVGVYTVMAEGTPVMPGSPMAWWSQVDLDRVRSITLPGSLHLLRHPVQVWRCRNDQDLFFEDVVTDLDTQLDPDLPLMVPRVLDGLVLSDPLPDASDVSAFHERFMESNELPLRWDVTA